MGDFAKGNIINSHTWAFGPPANYERFGGAGLRARQAVHTGWKACATNFKNFSEQKNKE